MKNFKFLFIITACIIAIGSVWVTNILVNNLAKEERKKMEMWAESVKLMASQTTNNDISQEAFNAYDKLILQFIEGNTTIPLILADQDGIVLLHKNIKVPEHENDIFFQKKIKSFKAKNEPIILNFDDHTVQYVYYDDSTVLKRLHIFPYAQLLVVAIFIAISFFALSSSKKAEQNKVWVGLSKETAHQLGTPISSLMAWMEYLKTKNIDPSMVAEIDKDVQRLNMIADRFSKIGSISESEAIDINMAIQVALEYMSRRISSKVRIDCHYAKSDKPLLVTINDSLFGWVIENLIKNAVDAMNGQGKIMIHIEDKGKTVKIDVSDTGKGISKSKFETIFHPGYTTKKRGWGLGLSLVRRIIESERNGKIYVLRSELNKGTTFRIELKKVQEKKHLRNNFS